VKSDFDLICFRIDGALRQLYSPEECSEAVKRGEVNAHTLIDIYWTDGRIERLAASEINAFAEAFAPPVVDFKAPESETAARHMESFTELDNVLAFPQLPEAKFLPLAEEKLVTVKYEVQPRVSVPLTAGQRGERAKLLTNITVVTGTSGKSPWLPKLIAEDIQANPELITSPAPPHPEVAPTEPSSPKTKTSLMLWLLLGALISLILVLFSNSGDEVTDATREHIETNQPAESAPDPLAALPEQSFYTARSVRLRVGPSSQSEARGRMYPRDTLVKGKIIPSKVNPTQRWLVLTQGIDSGLFIWAANLSKTKMPMLDTSASGEWYAKDTLQIRVGPSETAPIIPIDVTGAPLTLKLSQAYTVSGLVEDKWAEIALTGGGVGYVPITALTTFSSGVSLVDADNAAVEAAAGAMDETTQGRKMLISRACDIDDLHVLMRYESASGIRFAQVKIRGRGQRYIDSDIAGTPARTISASIWYAPIEANGDLSDMSGEKGVTTNKFLIKGRQTVFVKASLRERGIDEYLISFDCE
jgi:hypothetical protein